jgi:hypothetical protein
LSARLQASSVTTQAFAANLTTTAPYGRKTSSNRRRGSRPAAVFCFGDERPCSRKS